MALPDDPNSTPQRVRGHELRERIELVKRRIVAGETRRMIVHLIKQEWGLKPCMAYRYLKRATEEIDEIAKRESSAWLSEHIAIRRDIRRRANDAADFRSELAAAESEAKLLGIEPPTKLQHMGHGGGAIEFKDLTDEQLDTRIAILTTRIAELTGSAGAEPPGEGPAPSPPGPDGPAAAVPPDPPA